MQWESVVGTFKCSWRLIGQGAVQTLAVIKDFHVIKERVENLSGVLKLPTVYQLQFERAPRLPSPRCRSNCPGDSSRPPGARSPVPGDILHWRTEPHDPSGRGALPAV